MVRMLIASVLGFSAVAMAQSSSATHPAAPMATDQPPRVAYEAILQTDKPVQGRITGTTSENGTGVVFNIDFSNFPSEGAPFCKIYHEIALMSKLINIA
jgi:hypothetical protein